MIYFIQGAKTGLIKIGKAVDCQIRLKTLQTGSPDKLHILKEIYTDDVGMERLLHNRFRYCHSHGEWFYPKKELLEVIEQLPLFVSVPNFSLLLDEKRIFENEEFIAKEKVRHDKMGPGTGLGTYRLNPRNLDGLNPRNLKRMFL